MCHVNDCDDHDHDGGRGMLHRSLEAHKCRILNPFRKRQTLALLHSMTVMVCMMLNVHGYDCIYDHAHANESGSDYGCVRVRAHAEFRNDRGNDCVNLRWIDLKVLTYSQSIVRIDLNLNVRANASVSVGVSVSVRVSASVSVNGHDQVHVHDDYS